MKYPSDLAVVKHSTITPVEESFVRLSLISCFRLMNHEIMTLTQVKKEKFGLLFALLCSRFRVLIFWNYLLYIFMFNFSVNICLS